MAVARQNKKQAIAIAMLLKSQSVAWLAKPLCGWLRGRLDKLEAKRWQT